MRWGPRDRGSGTVLALLLVAVLATALVAALVLMAALVAGQRARSAADLAALAAAGELVGVGSGVPQQACATAARVARDNGALLVGCEVLPARPGLLLPVVEVAVQVDGPSGGQGVPGLGTAKARSRASGVAPVSGPVP